MNAPDDSMIQWLLSLLSCRALWNVVLFVILICVWRKFCGMNIFCGVCDAKRMLKAFFRTMHATETFRIIPKILERILRVKVWLPQNQQECAGYFTAMEPKANECLNVLVFVFAIEFFQTKERTIKFCPWPASSMSRLCLSQPLQTKYVKIVGTLACDTLLYRRPEMLMTLTFTKIETPMYLWIFHV